MHPRCVVLRQRQTASPMRLMDCVSMRAIETQSRACATLQMSTVIVTAALGRALKQSNGSSIVPPESASAVDSDCWWLGCESSAQASEVGRGLPICLRFPDATLLAET